MRGPWKNNNTLLRESNHIINDKMGYEEVTPEEVREKFGRDLKNFTVNFICEAINHQLEMVIPVKVRDRVLMHDRSEYVNANYVKEYLSVMLYWLAGVPKDLSKYEEYEDIVRDLSVHSNILNEEEISEFLNAIERLKRKYF